MEQSFVSWALQAINTSVMAVVLMYFLQGRLISQPSLVRDILPPRDQRIAALEAALSAKDAEIKRYFEQLVNALEAANRTIEKLVAEAKHQADSKHQEGA